MHLFKKFLILILTILSYLSDCQAIELDKSKLFINSNKLTINNADKSAHFIGNVNICFTDMTLYTSELIVFYEELEGKKTLSKILIPYKLKAVKPLQNEVIIADSANYIVNLRQLTLAGNVKMLKDGNVLVTDELVYFTKIEKFN